MIEIRNLTKKFNNVTAVDNLTLNIEAGIYGLIGQNGAGKSTLFRLISGVYQKDEGFIFVDGYNEDSEEAKKLVFFLSDDPYVERYSSIKGVIDFYECFYTIDQVKFFSLIKKFNLPTNGMIRNFSKGMKRQLFISLALSIDCKYLLLDEAFDGLDPIVLDTIKDELLKSRDEGKVIVVSSHNVNTLEKLVDSFIMVTKGRLSANETNEHFGTNFVKYQALYKNDVSKNDFINAGLRVVSFKKYGSIYNIVVFDEANLEEKINSIGSAILLERVPIDMDEIVKLSMLVARKDADYE